MISGPIGRYSAFLSSLTSLAITHWDQLKQEMGGKATLSRKKIALIAAGGVTALTGLVFFLTALTLLLTRALVVEAGWSALAAGAAATGIMGAVFTAGGILLIMRSKARLAAEPILPTQTIESFKASTMAMASPIAPPPNTQPFQTMNARNSINDNLHRAASAAEDQCNRARRSVGDTLHSLADKIEAAPLLVSALGWAETLLNPQSRDRALNVARGAAALPARHPLPAALIGAGLGWALWRQITREDLGETINDAGSQARGAYDRASSQAVNAFNGAAETAQRTTNRVRETVSDTAHRWADTARSAAATVRETAEETANRARGYYNDARSAVHDTAEHARNGAQRAREEAEAGLEKARDFAREQPVMALAGAAALGALVVLLSKSSRR